ncbi:TetR family transcriptional regulator [Streptomyces sp. NRRL B-1347]|uniref:TetR family transcriptional regulator n=1 Tax=Streptomyces sp. NRRL B-1347 TaxID=1476877 RepID=UPI000D14226A
MHPQDRIDPPRSTGALRPCLHERRHTGDLRTASSGPVRRPPKRPPRPSSSAATPKTRLAEISSNAGVSPGALHFHFENKAAVAGTVETTAATTLRRTAAEATAGGRQRPATAHRHLAGAGRAAVR